MQQLFALRWASLKPLRPSSFSTCTTDVLGTYKLVLTTRYLLNEKAFFKESTPFNITWYHKIASSAEVNEVNLSINLSPYPSIIICIVYSSNKEV